MKKSDEYANGMAKVTEQIIVFCQKEIEKLKNSATPNSIRQITNGGKIAAYNKILQKLTVKKRVIITKRRD